MIGQTILHYKITEKLGEGGMGVVYKAEDTKLERTVALKFLPRHVALNEDERKRFEIEAKAAAGLNHPNIATIHAIEEVDDETFIVMEYIEGRELREIIHEIPLGPPMRKREENQAVPSYKEEKGRFLSISNILDYATQIASGLQAAHEKDVTHRDIKSANIMVTDKDQVKIMDFGLAKVRGGAQVTKVGTTLGTAAYMSPEQARGDEAGPRSDIWSFGVVLYEMLTGQLPFPGDYEQVVIYSILSDEPQPVSNLRPETPEDLQLVVSQALAKPAAERFETAEELLAALQRVGTATGSTPRKSAAPQGSARFRVRRATVLVGFVLAVLTGVAYFFKPSNAAIDTLAILPLASQSGDPEMAYLGDGIAETLIFKLSQLPNLKVRSLSSVSRYQGKSPDLLKVGSDLKVGAVLTGRVAVRKDNLVIVVELVNTGDNSTIWGQSYNRSLADLMAVQDEISNDILSRLRLELSGETRQKVNKRFTDNAEAYQAYLKGQYFTRQRNKNDLWKAVKYYRQAIGIEPDYALAYAGLSQAYFLLTVYSGVSRDESLAKAEKAAEKALQIDDRLSEAHAALAVVLADYRRDYDRAEQELERAIQFDPNNVDAHHHYSYLLGYTGRHDAAIQEAKAALELDPLSPVMTRGLALVYFMAGQYGLALKYYLDCLEINPGSLSATFYLAFVYHEMGRDNESIAMLGKYHRLLGEDTLASRIEQTFVRSGYRSAIAELLDTSTTGFLSDQAVRSWLFAIVGENGQALESLQRAFEQQSTWLCFSNVHPALDSLRADPRVRAVLEKVFVHR